MMILNALFFLIWCISVNTHYTLYYSDIRQSSYPTFDCLYAYLIDDDRVIGKHYIRNYHLIPYCRRPDYNNEEQDVITDNIAKTISFKELKIQNITSEELLQWFAPIDVAEKYEMNLNDSDDVFHNCSSPWFGSRCQYKFDYDLSLSFNDIVQLTFNSQTEIIRNVTSGTCYRFLTGCNRDLWPVCLDWREICDGKFDCINGEDEEWCDQLEMSQCNDNEYRCHYGGQCIPLTFVKDSKVSIDCLDGSDETDYLTIYNALVNPFCSGVATFQCQERIAQYPWSFQCGDGQYVSNLIIPTVLAYCSNRKEIELSRFLLTSMDHISNISCQKAFYCALHFNRTFNLGLIGLVYDISYSPILDDVWYEDCESLSEHCLSEWLVIPEHPILFGFFQFVYFTNRSINEFKENVTPDLICFNKQRCPILLTKIVSIKIINGLTCFHSSNLINDTQMKDFNALYDFFYIFNEECLTSGIDKSCPNSSYFHCNKSMKCISYHRVGDGNKDCYFEEDELFDVCQLNDSKRYKCQGNSNKCVSQVVIGNGMYDCPFGEDEVFSYTQNIVTLVSFPNLCNIYNKAYLPLFDTIETDETNCNWWPCDNPYTHCDGTWHCSNGIDELNCPDSKCSYNEHQCQTKGLSYCLPLSHIYDKYLNYSKDVFQYRLVYFYNETTDISKDYISWNYTKCMTLDKLYRVDQTSLKEEDVCPYPSIFSILSYISHVNSFHNNESLCSFNMVSTFSTSPIYYFKAVRLGYFPEISMNNFTPTILKPNENKTIIPHIDTELTLYCHRGILIRSGRNQTKQCLCPPNYFGSRCQWQNQRISLTLQLIWRSTESSIIIFQVIIMIIDENGQISPSNDQITYMPTRDCNTKFNIYLLYPNRPKSLSSNYSIRIDLYEKTQLNYWSSWFISIPFQFLPVNRIVTQLIIPEKEDNEQCTCLSCGEHGQCRHYINNKSLFFCQCDQGYSGSQCQIKHECNCSNDSFCFNSSICICPLHKFGFYCHLRHTICASSNNPCQNKGICIPSDDRIGLKDFICFCRDDYSGSRCENKNNQIDLNFNEIILFNTSLLLLHFITAFKNAEHERITQLKKIPFDDKNLTIYVTQSFNILLIQIPNQNYYLAVLREIFRPSEHIYTKISLKQRCLSIDELNNTFGKYEYLQRVKSYPLLCRKYSELKCFYDQDLMCICDVDRFSNCFSFNQTINNDCQGFNYCQNDGQCFHNNETCSTKFSCICQDCYYGSQCQFSTKGFIISLDSILAYHIKPNLSINEQPLIIKISIGIMTIIFILGFINGLLSFITFRRKKSREVGTGYYLLFSSIISIFIIIVLSLKFCELILSQMSLITNRSFLNINCILVDVSLRILLALSEWLNACVATERMINVIKGTGFDKKQSRKISKWIILIVFIFLILTHIHDPIHRELIDDIDIDEKRIWCFIKYSSSINIYNSFLTLFNFLVPFSINIISSIWIILSRTRNRGIIQTDRTFQQHLYCQIKEHRHILIAPFVLILLNLPRLIISFVNGCMKSSREPWLYLCGYFLSFIPSMLTFIIFILPSKKYKDEFDIIIEHIIRRFRINF